MESFEGRGGVVTGGGSGIGRGICLALAEAGHDIAVHYAGSEDAAEETAETIRGMGRNAVTLQADLTVEAEMQRLVPAAHGAQRVLAVLDEHEDAEGLQRAAQDQKRERDDLVGLLGVARPAEVREQRCDAERHDKKIEAVRPPAEVAPRPLRDHLDGHLGHERAVDEQLEQREREALFMETAKAIRGNENPGPWL